MAKKILTGKQQLILLLLYCFRFLNSKQIQEFLKHKDHRRINSWLKVLSGRNYIVKDFKPIFGTLTKPAVCYLTIKGRAHIRNNYHSHFPKYLKRIARDKNASKSFRIRCQIIADWYLMLFQNTNEEGKKRKTGIAILDYLETQLSTEIDEKKEKISLNTVQFFYSCLFPLLYPPWWYKTRCISSEKNNQRSYAWFPVCTGCIYP